MSQTVNRTTTAPSRSHAQATIEREKRRMYSIGLFIALLATIPPTTFVLTQHQEHIMWHVLLNGSVAAINIVLIAVVQRPGMLKWVEPSMTIITLGYVLAWDIINLALHRFPLQEYSGEDPVILIGILLLVFTAPPHLVKRLVLCIFMTHMALKWANAATFPWSTQHVKILTTDLIIGVISVIVVVFATYSELVWKTSRESDRLHYLTHKNVLADLPNRRTILSQLSTEKMMTVMMCDIDGFDQLRRNTGQYCGDVTLLAVAGCLTERFEGSGMVGRWGGEEFIIVANQANPTQALELIEHALADIADLSQESPVTASAGATVQRPGESLTEMFLRCDALLYLAKQQGGNQVLTDWTATTPPQRMSQRFTLPEHNTPEPSHPLF